MPRKEKNTNKGNEKSTNKMPNNPKNGLGNRIKKIGTALALSSILLTTSCKDITTETVRENWERTESLKESYNSTYESIEGLKKQLREIEKKLANPNLNNTERQKLDKQKEGLVKNIKKLQKDLDEYLLDWNEAVEIYCENKAKLAGDQSKNLNLDSSTNKTDGKLESIPSPND